MTHSHAFTIIAAIVAMPVAPIAGVAQQSAGLVVGVAPFLTRDRGWNFENNVAFSAGVEWTAGWVNIRMLGALRLGAHGNYVYTADYPTRPGSTENGVGAGVHVMMRRRVGYVFAGPERFQVRWQTGPAPARGGTWLLASGAGLGGDAWALEARYGWFARRLGATRGHLDVGVMWRRR